MTTTDVKSHISIRNLNMMYGNNHALKNINIDIPDKKLTAIIGPSGCGKTTLLKTFNRLIEGVDGTKITGEVLVDGENIYAKSADVTNIRKKMGLLNQRPTPLPMSIFDNIAFGMRIHGEKNKKLLQERVEYYLRLASLWDEVKDRLATPAARLSIGQQQRLCLARGLAVEPEIILGDEPTSALDPISTKHIENKFSELKEQYTIVMVTHILR
ncbi:MAG: phosphate ABC transporter ATP-binding protein, partial [Bacteroidetes bacterium]|nr:phosphate ABC transporter ATP-binding protein [Bacteroidota bacterium]